MCVTAGRTGGASGPDVGGGPVDCAPNPDGTPDLQGFWTTQTYTPLQRPERFEGRAFLTDEEMAELTVLVDGRRCRPAGAEPAGRRADEAERQARTQQNDPTHYNNAQWLTTERSPRR